MKHNLFSGSKWMGLASLGIWNPCDVRTSNTNRCKASFVAHSAIQKRVMRVDECHYAIAARQFWNSPFFLKFIQLEINHFCLAIIRCETASAEVQIIHRQKRVMPVNHDCISPCRLLVLEQIKKWLQKMENGRFSLWDCYSRCLGQRQSNLEQP